MLQAFCIMGSIFLQLNNLSWIHDVLTIGQCAYLIILVVCLIVLAMQNNLDYRLEYLFMVIGAVFNLTGKKCYEQCVKYHKNML